MKHFAARFSDTTGPTNPKGILSPHFLLFKRAVDNGDAPDNIIQALEDWLSSKGTKPSAVNAILQSADPSTALDSLLELVGGGLRREALPPQVVATLQQAVKRIAGRHIASREAEMDKERAGLASLRQRYQVEATMVVDRLLGI